jgi:hypothetical protein
VTMAVVMIPPVNAQDWESWECVNEQLYWEVKLLFSPSQGKGQT